jgi:RNA polymerase primary sigma factor
VPADLPGHLARLCESQLLTATEETELFRQMNFLKFRANLIRGGLNEDQPDADAIESAEQLLEAAQQVRDRIVQSNMRLVMSVVKKFVSPQHSFDDLLSDGIYTLMQAVEKFDYDRGFRFSTYAYRAIARNAYRKITDRQKENTRFIGNSEEVVFDVLDEKRSSSLRDDAWDRLRSLLAEMMNRLDRRERFIIRSRYAFGSHRKVRTFQCLADKLGVSKERVRQLEQRAVAKLRRFATEQQLDELVSAAFA